jgi:hypothetical protein
VADCCCCCCCGAIGDEFELFTFDDRTAAPFAIEVTADDSVVIDVEEAFTAVCCCTCGSCCCCCCADGGGCDCCTF